MFGREMFVRTYSHLRCVHTVRDNPFYESSNHIIGTLKIAVILSDSLFQSHLQQFLLLVSKGSTAQAGKADKCARADVDPHFHDRHMAQTRPQKGRPALPQQAHGAEKATETKEEASVPSTVVLSHCRVVRNIEMDLEDCRHCLKPAPDENQLQ
jgi:hypothetical protein